MCVSVPLDSTQLKVFKFNRQYFRRLIGIVFILTYFYPHTRQTYFLLLASITYLENMKRVVLWIHALFLFIVKDNKAIVNIFLSANICFFFLVSHNYRFKDHIHEIESILRPTIYIWCDVVYVIYNYQISKIQLIFLLYDDVFLNEGQM